MMSAGLCANRVLAWFRWCGVVLALHGLEASIRDPMRKNPPLRLHILYTG